MLSSDSFEHKFKKQYKLSGVAISKTEFYICHPTKEPGQLQNIERWWHIKYTYKDNPDDTQIDRTETTMDRVLADLTEFNEDAILVYANATALEAEPIPLSAALETFVQKDNANFKQEVADAQRAWETEDTARVGNWFEGDNGWPASNVDRGAFTEHAYQSSPTLTPDAEVEPPPYDEVDPPVTEIHLEEEKPMEMQEINGGIGVWAGGRSSASSETVGRDDMDMKMEDVDVEEKGAGTVHIEHAGKGTERKGG